MRLSYRIAAQSPVMYFPGANTLATSEKEKHFRIADEHRRCLQAANPNIIIADNVAEYFCHSHQEWKLAALPCIAPPFQFFVVDAKLPPDASEIGSGQATQEIAIFCYAFPLDEAVLSSGYLTDLCLYGAQPANPATWNAFQASLEIKGWLCLMTVFLSAPNSPICGKPVYVGQEFRWAIAADGKFKHQINIPATTQQDPDANRFAARLLGLVISFMHCRNVQRCEVQHHQPTAKVMRRTKLPRFRHHVLKIDAFRAYEKSQATGTIGTVKALHQVRGNFAEYTEDHKLFGKHVGRFFRPQHLRGNIAAGTVDKDYEVAAPPD